MRSGHEVDMCLHSGLYHVKRVPMQSVLVPLELAMASYMTRIYARTLNQRPGSKLHSDCTHFRHTSHGTYTGVSYRS